MRPDRSIGVEETESLLRRRILNVLDVQQNLATFRMIQYEIHPFRDARQFRLSLEPNMLPG